MNNIDFTRTYQCGLIVGRFQPLHSGHEEIIRLSLRLCEKTIVFIGSPDESHTSKNPFPYELRKTLLQNVFGDSIEIAPIKDIGIGNPALWGEYLLQSAEERFGIGPDLFITGKEDRRTGWFDGPTGSEINELIVSKETDISSSQLREWMVRNDFESWKRFVNVKNHGLFAELRRLVLESMNNTQTNSI